MRTTNVLSEPTSTPAPIPVSSLDSGVQSVSVTLDGGAQFSLVPFTKRGKEPGAFKQMYPRDKKGAHKGGGDEVLNEHGHPELFLICQPEIVDGGKLYLITLGGRKIDYQVRQVRVYRKKKQSN